MRINIGCGRSWAPGNPREQAPWALGIHRRDNRMDATMPSDSSFDIVSELNVQEMDNAVNQAIKEITTRYDFKGTAASVSFDRKLKELTLTGDAEQQLESVRKVLV